jgi:ribonuclease P protein component
MNRFRVIVGKSVAAKSVQRHDIKRRFAEALLKLPARGLDAVLTVLPAASRLSRGEIQRCVAEALLNVVRR